MTRFLLVLLLSAAAFANVFGPDRRIAAPLNDMPYKMIGKIIIEGQKVSDCTASLVAPNWVLTNLHCVAEALMDEKAIIIFKLAYAKGKHQGQARGTQIIAPFELTKTGISWRRQQDYAFVKLNAPLGTSVGWFKIAPDSLAYLGQPAILAGYSSDISNGDSMTYDPTCTLVEPDGPLISHSCHMAAGTSGSPIFNMINNEPVIIALNSGHFRPKNGKKGAPTFKLKKFSNDVSNIAVNTSYFYPTLSKLKDN